MTSILASIFAVFSEVGTWIVSAVTDLIPMFYAEGALTFLGVLAVAGLAFSIVFLVYHSASVQSDLHVKRHKCWKALRA